MSNPKFHWDDPLLLDQQLTSDERMVRDAAAAVSAAPQFEKHAADVRRSAHHAAPPAVWHGRRPGGH